MAVKLNRKGFEFGKKLVSEGKIVRDERDAWSEDQPSSEEENEFIRWHGYEEYAKWHLGVDEERPEDTKREIQVSLRGFQQSASLCGAVRGDPRGAIPAQ